MHTTSDHKSKKTKISQGKTIHGQTQRRRYRYKSGQDDDEVREKMGTRKRERQGIAKIRHKHQN